MLGFLFKVAAGTVKLGVKYIIVPAVVSVAITVAAELLAESIRNHTPQVAVANGATASNGLAANHHPRKVAKARVSSA